MLTNDGLMSTNASLVLMKGLSDTRRVTWLVSMNDAFMSMSDAFVRRSDAFVRRSDAFVTHECIIHAYEEGHGSR